MRCRIEPHTIDGLKVIPEIPDIALCMLEGQNGVGKTVALQLLELLSGSIPEDFTRRPLLWPSMRRRLCNTAVEIDQLQGGRSLKVVFTPQDWPIELPDKIDEWLGTAVLDDQSSTILECSQLLSVTRIAGDEDLEETLRKRVDTLSAYLKSAEELVRARGAAVEKHLNRLVPDLQRADPAIISNDVALMADIEERLNDAQSHAQTAEQRLNRLLNALETKRKLEALGQATEALLLRRNELIITVQELTAELQTKEDEAEAAESAFAAEGDAQKKLADAERLLRHRRSRLSNIQRGVKSLATRLSIGTSDQEVRGAVSACKELLRQLHARHRILDSSALVRDLIDGMILPLEAARNDAADQILIKSEDAELTVEQTYNGISRRRQEIADQPEPGELRELASRIGAQERLSLELTSLANQIEQLNLQRERVTEAEADMAEAAKQADYASDSARLSRETNQAVGRLQETLTKAHADLASLEQQIGAAGATSKEDAETDLRAALEELGLTIEQLDESDSAARRALIEADSKVTDLQAAVSTIRRRLAMHQADVDLMIERILRDTRYSWLLEASPELSRALENPTTRIKDYAKVRTALLRASESAFQSADLLSSLIGIAAGYFSNTDPQVDDQHDLKQVLRPAFTAVLGQNLMDSLNRPLIREAIFDGAEVISVQASTRELVLRDDNGRENSRPMEAFSSGERAFAFTQARIADLEPPTKPNCLLALDEFGAYVAADRLPDLVHFLANDIPGIADQVVVVLPLHVNYEAEIADTRGELHNRYQERIDQIKDRGYCAVVLE